MDSSQLQPQVHMKVRYVKIYVKHLSEDSAFLSVSIHDDTEKREYVERKNNFARNLTEFQSILTYVKTQAIDALRLARKIQASNSNNNNITSSCSLSIASINPLNPSVIDNALLLLTHVIDLGASTWIGELSRVLLRLTDGRSLVLLREVHV